ncbi:MAG TPA: carbonic anhydrase [Chthoniobacterales bacterium]|nr:carbonic anhydrase [Chthoniobacterales bacterium]
MNSNRDQVSPASISGRDRVELVAFVILLSIVGFVFAGDHPTAAVSADDALAKLKEGNARFANSKVSQGKPTAARRAETAQAQHPFAIVLGCADSRTTPEIIFDQNIGDIFVARNAGNLVDEHTLGTIEYAVEHLRVRLIVVLGHERCGAVRAAASGGDAPGHIQSLVRDIQPAVQAVKDKPGDQVHLAVAENARLMAERIRKEAEFGEIAKDVKILSAVYDLDSGKVDWGKE